MFDLPVIARFTMDGEPASKARARFTNIGSKKRVYTPEKTRMAEEKMARLFRSVAQDHILDENATYGVMAVFFCGTRQRRDVDNMMKLILDGLNGIAWPDDNQVIEISGRKSPVSPLDARTEVVIYRVGEVSRLTTECLQCGKEFTTFPSWSDEKRRRKFCTSECGYAYRVEQNMHTCTGCGKEFTLYQNPNKYGKYCSPECSAATGRRTLNCDRCGKEFTRPKSLKRVNNYCSADCAAAVARERRAIRARGVCLSCGGSVTKKSYKQCMQCRKAGFKIPEEDE